MTRRMSHAAREYFSRQRLFENIENRGVLNRVLDYPKSAQANIERFKQKMEEIKSSLGYTAAEKEQKIAWCEVKIKEIQKSIDLYYVQHPWVMR